MSATVPATLVYVGPSKDGSDSRPVLWDDPATGKRTSNYELVKKEVLIENVRGKESSYTLDAAGFQFITHPSAHKTFTDDGEIKRVYYPETEALIKKFTGANRVIIFNHAIRRHRPGERSASASLRQPSAQVHVDQTPALAERLVHKHTSKLAPKLLKHRYQIINLWRPISHPADDFPLALCDYRSVNWDQDLVLAKLQTSHRDGEVISVKYNPEHKWKYLKGTRPDEGILIKCFDSQMDGSVAVLTPHTAFIDPTAPKDAPLRESIEVRALVFYDKGPLHAGKL